LASVSVTLTYDLGVTSYEPGLVFVVVELALVEESSLEAL